MQPFTDINTSVNQILTILSKLPQQPSASSVPSTSTTQTSWVSPSPGTSTLASTSSMGNWDDQAHPASAPAVLALSSDLTGPSLPARSVLHTQRVLSALGNASTSEQNSALAIGGSLQPSVPAVSVSTSLPPVPGYLVGKIVNNEFVDFVLLRPCNLTKLPSREPRSGQLAKMLKEDLLPVATFSEWAEAWAVYTGIIARKAPGKIRSLVGYFLLILS